VLKFLQHFKESKERKQRMKREEYGGNKDRNIEEMVFVIFGLF